MSKCAVCHDDRVLVCLTDSAVRHLVACPACTDATPLNELLEGREHRHG